MFAESKICSMSSLLYEIYEKGLVAEPFLCLHEFIPAQQKQILIWPNS